MIDRPMKDTREFRVSWQRVRTTHPERRVAKHRSKLFQSEAGARSWYHYLDMSRGEGCSADLKYIRFEERTTGDWVTYESIGAADA